MTEQLPFSSGCGRRFFARLAFGATLLTGLALAPAYAQVPVNDDPCGAVSLAPQGVLCTSPVLGTTVGATTTVPSGYTNPSTALTSCGGGGTLPKDVWYKFTTAATGQASFGAALTVSGNAVGSVRLYQAGACTGPFTEVACSSSGQANTVAPRLTTGSLQPATTYYVQLAAYADSDPTGPFTICLSDGPGLPTCGVPTLGTPTYASPTTATIPFTAGVNNTLPLMVLVTGPNGFSQTTTAGSSPIQLSGLSQGTTYTVQATASCAGSGQTATPVTRTISTPTRYCSTGLGGGCGQTNITGVRIIGTTLDNTNQNPACANGYSNFAFSGNTTTTLRPGTPYQLSVQVASVLVTKYVAAWMDFNQNNLFEANENIMPAGPANNNNPLTVTFQVPVGTAAGAIGLRVRSAGSIGTSLGAGGACAATISEGETEDYTVTIGAAVACATPTGLTVTNIGSTTATLNFTPVAGAASYTITYSSFSAVVPVVHTIVATTSPVQLTGLVPGTQSGAEIVSNCGFGSVSALASVSFIMQPLAPENDECQTSTLLFTGANPLPVPGTTNYGSVSNAVPALPAACAGAASINQDVWYRFVATQPTHDVVVGITNNGAVLLEAFAGTCAGFIRLGCVRQVVPNTNQTERVILPLTNLVPGQTYYIRVGQTVAQTYAYNFVISIRTPGLGYCETNLGGSPTCAGPNLISTAITGTSLSNLNTVCGANGQGPYVLYPASGNTTAQLSAGQTYQIQSTIGNGPADVSLWIDYNQNALFEASEHTQLALNASISAASFTVPTTALSGATRLRLRSRAVGAGNGPTDACTNFAASGETEDYIVTVASTAVPPALCPPPRNVSVGSLTPTTATVSFTAPTGGTTGYVVQYQAGGGAIQTMSPPPTTSPFTLTGLLPSTTYTVCISSSCTAGGTSPLACASSFTTPTPPPCGFVTAATAGNISSTGATISFTAPGTAASSYTVTYQAAGGTAQTLSPAPTVSPFSLGSLSPGTAYTVRIITNCTAGGVSGATALSFTTLTPPCPAPTNVVVTPLTANSATITFSPPTGAAVVSYTAEARTLSGTTQSTVTGPASPLVLTALRTYDFYTVTVTTNCSGGFNSGPSAPSAPFQLVLGTRNAALAAEVGLAPNPAHLTATLTLPANLRQPGGEVLLLNTLGQLLRQQKLPAATAQLELPLAGLAAGVYSVQVRAGEVILMKRLVVE